MVVKSYLSKHQTQRPDKDLLAMQGWREGKGFYISLYDNRLTEDEKQFLTHLGNRIYGNGEPTDIGEKRCG